MQLKNNWIFGVALVILTILLVAAAVQKSFWEDESWSAYVVQAGQAKLTQATSADVHPPLYLNILSIWGRIFGYSELGLRSLSILCTLFSFFILIRLTDELFGRQATQVTALLFSLSPLILLYGHNARYYSMVMALTLLITYMMVRYLASGKVPYLVIYAAGGVALVYLLYAAAIVLVICNLWWFIIWFQQRHRPGLGRSIVGWLITQVAVALLSIPGALLMISVLGKAGGQSGASSNLIIEVAKRSTYTGLVFSIGETLSPLSPAAWVGIILVVVLVIKSLIEHKKVKNVWLPVLFVFIISIANILVSLNGLVAVTWQNLPYRILYAYPFFVMWLGVGITQIKSRLALILVTLLGIVFCIANVNYFRGEQFLRPSLTVPWRSIFTKIASEKKPPTVVLCYGDFACHYYANLNGYGMYTPGNWAGLSKQNFNDVWYIRSNLGRSLQPDDREAAVFTEISSAYPDKDESSFAPQDLGIRRLKSQWLHMDDYEYRVNVYHFNR